jgi:hypothetical protein
LGHLSASLLSHCPVKGYSFLLGLKRRGLQGAIHAVSEATVSRVRPRPRRSQRHRHDRWKATPTAADALRRCDQGKRHGFQTLLAAYRGAPKGAPNVLLIMTDDQGYGVSGTFGGVIPTPAMDRIAKAGLRYTQFHSTALCSPTRAALITGRNHHSVGYGVIGEMSTGFPGYDSVIGPESTTITRSVISLLLRLLKR